MEDLRKVAMEIGIMQQAENLSHVCSSQELQSWASGFMPLPQGDMATRIDEISKWLIAFKKDRYLFLMPEIALAEAMAEQVHEIFFIIPSTMDAKIRERIENNLPKKGKVQVLHEMDPHGNFFPEDTMLVVSGYLGGDRLMILEETIRATEQHSMSFYGRKAFVPYVELDAAVRYDGWMELARERINAVWRAA